MTLNAIIDYNKSLNSETYILFADAYKCFDKLNLKNYILYLYYKNKSREAITLIFREFEQATLYKDIKTKCTMCSTINII